jgi:hypothetical protein
MRRRTKEGLLAKEPSNQFSYWLSSLDRDVNLIDLSPKHNTNRASDKIPYTVKKEEHKAQCCGFLFIVCCLSHDTNRIGTIALSIKKRPKTG